MPGDFDLVKERIDIVALVGEKVALKRAGRIYKGLCPFHGEKTPSFTVDPERRTYKCFGCGEGGDVFTWLEKTDGLEPVEALKVLAERAGVELTSRRAPAERERETRLQQVAETARFYYRQALRGTPRGKEAAGYLARRGIAPETIEKFGLGYAPDLRDGLLLYLKKKGFTGEEGVATGVLLGTERGTFDRFRDRLMVPINDARGRPISFGGRAMRDDQPGPKYMNTPNTPLFNKSGTLYALDVARPAIRKESTAVIVEGYFDAIACHQAGFGNVVAAMGTALTEQQYRILDNLKVERAIVAFDGDAAGQRSAESRGRELLQAVQRHRQGALRSGGRVETRTGLGMYVTVLPENTDPDDLAREDPKRLRALFDGAEELVTFVIERTRERWKARLADPEARLRYLDDVLSVIREEPETVRREVYLSSVANTAGVDPAFLRQRLERAPAAASAPRTPPPGVGELAAAPTASGKSAPVKQTPTVERYVMALLTRFPEEAARVDLVPEDFATPELRALFEHLRTGKGPSTDLPAELAAVAAAVGASAPEMADDVAPGQAIEIAALSLREQNLRSRLNEVRADLAAQTVDDVGALDAEVTRLVAELGDLMRRRERRTVLQSETEREESE